ncbi:hypothetical protein AVEN_241606-1 [Araneus ventricosus]|uniref:Uncharacterized protein n=1 Tax=Araneus ventricosus TaxID=182803 RepID=A0A4Y2TAB1_ARAVE|nr:hypothetical protein AVEN_241606-1 [Araneus ventricosus]
MKKLASGPDFTDFKPASKQKEVEKKNSPNKQIIPHREKIPQIYMTSRLEVLPTSITTKDKISTHKSALKPSVIANLPLLTLSFCQWLFSLHWRKRIP